jgi:hypothetical protein
LAKNIRCALFQLAGTSHFLLAGLARQKISDALFFSWREHLISFWRGWLGKKIQACVNVAVVGDLIQLLVLYEGFWCSWVEE